MSNSFMKAVKKQSNKGITKNLAKTYVSTGNSVLDFFSHAGSMRGQDISELFGNAFAEDRALATAALYQLRDCRGGSGERELFRKGLQQILDIDIKVFQKVFKFVPEYGRWDDLFPFIQHEIVGKEVTQFLLDQLRSDIDSDKPSLLAKWLKSINTSSKESVRLAAYFANALGWSFKQYRQTLSKLRAKLKVVERQMSANEWDKIVYEHVPSRANLLYNKAFFRHDPERRKEFIERALNVPMAARAPVIKATTLYPYEMVYRARTKHDDTIEALWRNQPNLIEDEGQNAICVWDTSGSMQDWGYYGNYKRNDKPKNYTPS